MMRQNHFLLKNSFENNSFKIALKQIQAENKENYVRLLNVSKL